MSGSEQVSPQLLVQRLAHRGLTLGTAESLTAGAVAARIAEVPGASTVLRGGVVSYCSTVKHDLLGVDAELLEARGAVDPSVAAAMARGAGAATGADVGISTTGVAGPEPHGGRAVGTVYLGLACRGAAADRLGLNLPAGCEGTDAPGAPHSGWLSGALLHRFDGDRAAIRQAAADRALELVEALLHTEAFGVDEALEWEQNHRGFR